MPRAPSLSPEMLQQMGGASGSPPADPSTFLMAAADLHSSGEFQSAPVPQGKDLQSGKASGKRHKLKVVR